MKLYHFGPSSASFRVRIALSLKQIDCEFINTDLRAKEQFLPEFKSISPASRVPVLIDENRTFLQSAAIIEYLDERFPETRLIPPSADDRIYVRSITDIIASDIHPLGNISVLRFLKKEFGAEQEKIDIWRRHWIEIGFASIETLLSEKPPNPFVIGSAPGIAECYLIPQIFNARVANVDLSAFPLIRKLEEYCMALPAFADVAPDKYG